MERNNLFPVFLKLEELETLIVGGGNVALEKLTGLLKSSPAARITIVAGKIQEPIQEISKQNSKVRLVLRDFEEADLDAVDIVILATDNRELHEHIRNFTKKRRLL